MDKKSYFLITFHKDYDPKTGNIGRKVYFAVDQDDAEKQFKAEYKNSMFSIDRIEQFKPMDDRNGHDPNIVEKFNHLATMFKSEDFIIHVGKFFDDAELKGFLTYLELCLIQETKI